MRIEVEFLRDNRLVIVHFVGPLNLGEYMQFVRKIHADYYEQAKKPIHSILDLSQVQGMPRNVLSNALSVSKLKHRNDGLIVFVANSDLTQRFLEIFVRLTRDANHRLCRTVEEATALIDTALQAEALSEATTAKP